MASPPDNIRQQISLTFPTPDPGPVIRCPPLALTVRLSLRIRSILNTLSTFNIPTIAMAPWGFTRGTRSETSDWTRV